MDAARSNNHVEVIHLTDEDVQAVIDRVFREHPYLEGHVPERDCCRGHAEDEVRVKFGPKAVKPWMELETARWFQERGAT